MKGPILFALLTVGVLISFAAGGEGKGEMNDQPPVYLVIQGVLAQGAESTYTEYLAGTRPLMERYGVTVEAVGAGFPSEHTTASWPVNGLLRFPDRERAEAFLADPDYARIRPLRDAAYAELHLSFFSARAARVPGPRQVAERAFEHFRTGIGGGSFEPFLAMLSEDFELCFPMGRWQGCHHGREQAAEFFEYFRQAFPEGLTASEPRVTGTGNTVVFEFEDSGRLRGKPYRNRVAIALDVEGGKISRYREYFGLVGPPPQPVKEEE